MEIERMWQLKTSVIPIVVGALVLVKRGTAKHLKKILGKQNLAEMQKILLTSTEHIKKSVINISYNTKDQRKMKTQNLKKKKKKISLAVVSGFGQGPGSWIVVNCKNKKKL